MIFLVICNLIYQSIINNESSVKKEILETGSCGTDVSYNFNGSLLNIFGSGPMSDFSKDNQIWSSISSQVTSINIESGVTSIGAWAFMVFI